ncbi:arginine-tRNA-protein transferase [Spirosoma sp.]|uniref:arginine-tRNA-protein transferase n=1 Tax=Spirosoma sp. TaxID=1899569 RepID=UPI003B3A0CF6
MKGTALDLYLSRGYFRMQQDIFTCQFVLFDDRLCSVHWLRIVLPKVTYGPKQLRLLRINEKFSVDVKPFTLSGEIEALYSLYRDSIDFDAPASVEACLLDGATQSIFNTYVVEVRDGGQLIAAGIFDNGSRSIAGIMNFYHPDYRKQSLGKYLILQKINYAQRQQKMYYYPGYLVRNYPKFDYKLFACESATEVFDSMSGKWLPFSWETVNRLAGD